MLRSLQIGLDWFPERAGGLPRYFYEFLSAGRAAGLDLRGLVAGSPNVTSDTMGQVTAFAERTAPMPQRFLSARRGIRRAMEELKPAVVGSHFSLYTQAGLDCIDRPLVVHFHGPWAMEAVVEGSRSIASLIRHWVESSVYRRADTCIVLSAAFGRLLCERYRVPSDRIRIVPGGLDSARFRTSMGREEARRYLGWPTDRPIVFAVRRLVRRMGLESAIAAVGELQARHPDLLLLIGGRGALAGELEQAIAGRGLTKNVRLLGFVGEQDLPLAYRAADISLVPSVSLEGFGLTAAESLAAGTPVLVTPVGGLPEVVGGLDDNMVLEGGQPGQIAAGIEAALFGGMRLPGAPDCAQYAADRFDWQHVTSKIRDIYAELL